MPALGERFRAAREARGLSLSHVSEQLHIRSVYLAAIEDENWAAMGPPVYARGFLKTYARFLGLDSEEILAALASDSLRSAAHPDSNPGADGDPDLPGRPRNLSPVIWVASLVAVALIAFVVYNEVTLQRSSGAPAGSSPVASASASSLAGTSALASQSPVPGPPAPVRAGREGARTLQVVLFAPSWLRVAVDGSVSMEGTFPAGTSKLFHGKTALLRVGNAGGVYVYVDGKDVGALGKPGAVVERAFAL